MAEFISSMRIALQAILNIVGIIFVFVGVLNLIESQQESDGGSKAKAGKALGVGVGIIVVANVGVPALINYINNQIAVAGS